MCWVAWPTAHKCGRHGLRPLTRFLRPHAVKTAHLANASTLSLSLPSQVVGPDGAPALIPVPDTIYLAADGSPVPPPADAAPALPPRTTLPSVVAYLPGGGRVVGGAARRGTAADPANTVQSAKRLMGRSLAEVSGAKGGAAAVGRDTRRSAKAAGLAAFSGLTSLVPGDASSPAALAPPASPASPLLPEHVSADVLRALLAAAAAADAPLHRTPTRAVVSVPAHFLAAARAATLAAAHDAGLATVRLLREPIAAAIGYGVAATADATILVLDLGGGTFDVALLEVGGRSRTVEVLASGGDPALGGDDWDAAVVGWLGAEHLAGPVPGWASQPGTLAGLRSLAEAAKVALSCEDAVRLTLPLGPRPHPVAVLTRAKLDELAGPLYSRAAVAVDEACYQVREERRGEERGGAGKGEAQQRSPRVMRHQLRCKDPGGGGGGGGGGECGGELLLPLPPPPPPSPPGILDSPTHVGDGQGKLGVFAHHGECAAPNTVILALTRESMERGKRASGFAWPGERRARHTHTHTLSATTHRLPSQAGVELGATVDAFRARQVQAKAPFSPSSSSPALRPKERPPVSRVLLVGAPTRAPGFRAFVRNLTGLDPEQGLGADVDPDAAVALGAAVQAAALDRGSSAAEGGGAPASSPSKKAAAAQSDLVVLDVLQGALARALAVQALERDDALADRVLKGGEAGKKGGGAGRRRRPPAAPRVPPPSG